MIDLFPTISVESIVFAVVILVIAYVGYLVGFDSGFVRKSMPIECPYCNEQAKPIGHTYTFGYKKAFENSGTSYRCTNYNCRMSRFTLREMSKDG